MGKWLRRLLVLAILVAAGFALRMTVFREKPVPVTVYRVARGQVEDVVTNSKAGTVKTRRRASLSTEIGGRVVALAVREGQQVSRGDVLVRLNDADVRARAAAAERAVDAARSQLDEACTNAEQADRDLVRNRKLAADGIVSQQLLDQFQSGRDAAAAACRAARSLTLEAEATLEVAKVELDKTVLRAPFDGVIAEVSTEVGEWITPSPPGLPIPAVIEMLDKRAIYVSAPLDEVDVARVREELRTRITLDAYPGQAFYGRTVRVAPYVLDLEEQNRTFEVEVEFDDSAFAATLLPGSSADVEVILDVADDVLRVPSYALIEGHRVLVVRDDVLESVDVTTGLGNWQFTEIRSGLEAGEMVVVSLDRVEVQAGAKATIAGESER